MHRDLERRRFERLNLSRPCKVYEPRSGKYYPALSEDLSVGGAMLHIGRTLEFVPGDVVYVGIALKRRQAVILNDEMQACRVIRCLHLTDGNTVIAVEFDREAPVVQLSEAA